MRLLNFTIIKLTLCLILGIIIDHLFNVSVYTSISITVFFITLLLILFFLAKKQFIKTIWFGLSAFILMITIGVLTTNFHNHKNFSLHYTNQVSTTNDSSQTVMFRITDILKSGKYHNKYVIDILNVDEHKTNGKALLKIKKDSLALLLKVNDIYVSKTAFKDITQPLNPYQFDYKSYLKKKNIYYQLYISSPSILNLSSNTHTIFSVANSIRDCINSKLKLHSFKPNELAIINALLLGQRQDISKEIYSSYANSGAIHILAVSGLHVGIFLIIISFLLKPLEHIKHGELIKTALLILFLWSFAIITGLSASVTRAVTMFSIITIALNLNRPTNIYNTLAISLFIILLFKPQFLFDVGFQLSYLAVFSIVVIDPHLYNLWRPKNWFLDKYWHTLTVTISAQLGIIPISLYYFHQFPSLFFITNLVIIPLLGFIIGFGILIIILAIFGILPQFVANLFGDTIDLMNNFVRWISNQKEFLFTDIPFNIYYVLAAYSLIIFIALLLIKKRPIYLKLTLVCVIISQCVLISKRYYKPQNEFVIFHKNRFSLMGEVRKNRLIYSDNIDSMSLSKNNIIRDYVVGNQISHIKKDSFKPIYKLNKKTLLLIDSLGIYNVKSFSPDYILLRQSPKINLNRLIDSIKPKYIIADGSNYKSYIASWKAICRKRKLPFHPTGEKGAFIINY